MTVHTAHKLPPFTLVTGRYPSLPSYLSEDVAPTTWEPNYSDLEAYAEEVIAKSHELRRVAGDRLLKNDSAVRRRLIAKEKKYVYPATIFIFKVGQLVLRRRKRVGKLAARTDGPYRVIKVTGRFN